MAKQVNKRSGRVPGLARHSMKRWEQSPRCEVRRSAFSIICIWRDICLCSQHEDNGRLTKHLYYLKTITIINDWLETGAMAWSKLYTWEEAGIPQKIGKWACHCSDRENSGRLRFDGHQSVTARYLIEDLSDRLFSVMWFFLWTVPNWILASTWYELSVNRL